MFHHSGWANTFLSWEGFMPLSKISFVIYLIHLAVINVFVAQITFNFEATHLFQVTPLPFCKEIEQIMIRVSNFSLFLSRLF